MPIRGLKSNRGGLQTFRKSNYVEKIAAKYDLADLQESIEGKLGKFVNSHDEELIITEGVDDRRVCELIHSIASERDLRTLTSEGQMRITKPHHTRSVVLLNAQKVNLDSEQRKLICDHLKARPIDPASVDDHLTGEHGSSNERRTTNSFGQMMSLVPPRSLTSNEMREFRQHLPTYKMRQEILDAIEANRVTIITGGTGCGKTTQVPQFLLEEAYDGRQPIRIFCTQPRRLPAIAVSERVARERGEPLGDTVGYHIRLEQKTSENTVLTYCTSGVLLRMLSVDPLATGITHIILDEVHEREQNTDYLLIILREALKNRKDLKVILMSATIEGNREMFVKYFANYKPCGQCSIPSQLYSVHSLYLPEILALTGYMPSSEFVSWMGSGSNNFPPVDGYKESQQYEQLPTVRTVPDLQAYDHQHQSGMQSGMQSGWHQQSSQNNYAPNHYVPHHPEELTRSNTVPSNLQYAQSNYYPNQGYYYNSPAMYPPTTGYAMPVHQQQPYMYDHGWQSGYYAPNPQYSQQYQQQQMSHQQMPPPQPSMNQQQQMSHQQQMNQSSSQQEIGFQKKPFNFRRSGPNIDALLNEWLPNRPRDFDPAYLNTLNRAKIDNKLLINAYQDRGGQQWAESIDPHLALAVIVYCMDSSVDGSILVFLPGYEDIINLCDKVQLIQSKYKPIVYTLHSQMNSQDQQRVFEPAPRGCRKVILSTNIAEASLTIDDVAFVVDCGKVKEKTYDHQSRISQLKISWIAQSNAEQRAGRAGRCRHGFCFRLYSHQDYKQMLVTQVSEMQRSAIHELVLHAKMFAPNGMSVRNFLDCAPEPPSPQTIDSSIVFLEQLGALYNEEKSLQPPSYFTDQQQYMSIPQSPEPQITNLGRLIASLPLDPQLARLLLYGVAMSVLQPIISLVAALAYREPFTLPSGDEKQSALKTRDAFSRLDYSDHLMLLRVVNAYSELNPQANLQAFCRQKFLSKSALIMIGGIRRQLFIELKRLYILPSTVNDFDHEDFNHFSSSWPMVQGVIIAGSYPCIAFIRSGSKLRKIHTTFPAGQVASLHPSSSLRRQVQNKRPDNDRHSNDDEPNIECIVYQELSKIEEGLTLRTATAVTPLAALLFAGPIRIQKYIIDDFELVEVDYDAYLFEEKAEGPEHEVKAPDFETSDDMPMRYQHLCYVESDQELLFSGKFRDMRSMLQLRLKLASYFLRFLEQPLRQFESQEYELLRCVAQALELEHKQCKFNEVTDVMPRRQAPRNQPRFNQRNANQFNAPPRRPPSPLGTQNPPPRYNYSQAIPPKRYDDSPPADPTPTSQPNFDISSTSDAPPCKQHHLPTTQELPQSKRLIDELDRAQSKANTQTHDHRMDASSRNCRNNNAFDRHPQASSDFNGQPTYSQSSYSQSSYNQSRHSHMNTHNSYEDNNSESFNNGQHSQNRGNSYGQKNKTNIYVPPPQRNLDQNRRGRQGHRREEHHNDMERRMADFNMDDNRMERNDGRRYDMSRNHARVYSNPSYTKRRNDNSHQ